MTVYELTTNDELYSSFYLVEEQERKWLEDFAKNRFYTKEKLIDEWEPLVLLEKEVKYRPDFAFLQDEFFIVSEEAANSLKSFWGDNIELLPLLNDVEAYYILRVLPITDILDYERAVIQRLPYSNKILRIQHHSFQPEKVIPIFKIPENITTVFVSDDFVGAYYRYDFRGLSFSDQEQAWYYDSNLRG